MAMTLPPALPEMAGTSAEVLVRNRVLKNTYLLLAMTLVGASLTALFAMRSGAPLISWWMMLLVMLGGPFLISAFRNSVVGLGLCFAWTAALGYFMGPIVGLYLRLPGGEQIVFNALAGTAIIFFALSGYALTTRRDFSFMTGFLVVGSFVILAAIVANIFLQIPALSLAISSMAVLLMSGFILWDTKNIVNGGETNYIMATVALFANVYVLFSHLLNLMSFLQGGDN